MPNILSIDGGGVRGIIPISTLLYLRKVIAFDFLTDFDIQIGTSTGAIIVAFLNFKTTNHSDDLKSLEHLLDIYFNNIAGIFTPSRRSMGGFLGAKYRAENLRLSLQNIFSNATLSDLRNRCLFTTYNYSTREPHLIDSFEYPDTLIVDAIMASTAAPSYFPPATLVGFQGQYFLDGGLFANNPSLAALEMLGTKKTNKNDIKKAKLLSIGTGIFKPANLTPKGKITGSGKLFWAPKMPDLLIDTYSESTDRHCQLLLNQFGANNHTCPKWIHMNPQKVRLQALRGILKSLF